MGAMFFKPRPRRTREEIRRAAFHTALDEMLLECPGLPREEIDGRARTVINAVKARQGLIALDLTEKSLKDADGADEALDDDRQREGLLGQLAGRIAELEQAGADRCPSCGRFELDPERLAGVGGAVADPA